MPLHASPRDQNNKMSMVSHSPGQGKSLHSRISSASPVQSTPPLAGGGLVHHLCRMATPCPQLLSHEPHGVHSVKFPSSWKKNEEENEDSLDNNILNW